MRRYTATPILDVGCGTGEITSRLAAAFPAARAVGVDIIDAHLELARTRYAPRFGDRVTFARADAFELPFARCVVRPRGVPARAAGGPRAGARARRDGAGRARRAAGCT